MTAVETAPTFGAELKVRDTISHLCLHFLGDAAATIASC